MTDIRFNCEHCHQQLQVAADMAGQLIDCPACNKPIEIPYRRNPTHSQSIIHSDNPSSRNDPRQSPAQNKDQMRSFMRRRGKVWLCVLLCALVLFSVFMEPFGPRHPKGGLHYDYDFVAETRWTFDACYNLLRTETVRFSQWDSNLRPLPKGARGPVDSILKQTIYGKRIWSSSSIPIITYDAEHQTVTTYGVLGERTVTFSEFIGERKGKDAAVSIEIDTSERTVSISQFVGEGKGRAARFEIDTSGSILGWRNDSEGNHHSYIGEGILLRHYVNRDFRGTINKSRNWLVRLISLFKK